MTIDELLALADRANTLRAWAENHGQLASARCYKDIAHNAHELVRLQTRGDGNNDD